MKSLFYLAIIMLPLIGKAQDASMDCVLGKENASLIDFEMELSTNNAQVNYIQNVGDRLVFNLDDRLFHYHFYLVEDKVPKAFSLPGGYVYITTGLIPILQSEDELAFILSHEIMHIHYRHHVKQREKGFIPDIVPIPGNILTLANRKLGNIVNAPINKYDAIIFQYYGKRYEFDADKGGLELMAKAGYNPYAMESALNRIAKFIELAPAYVKENSNFPKHPKAEDRIAASAETLAELEWERKSPISNDFFAEFDGTLLGDDPNNGVFRGKQYLNPIFDFSVDFPETWSTTHAKSDVGAYDKKTNTAILLTIDAPSYTPKAAGELFVQRLQRACKSKLKTVGDYEINGDEAYKVTFECKSNGNEVFATVIWTQLEDKLIRFVGVYPKYMAQQVENTAQSLRSLTMQEMLSFNAKHFQVVPALEGESLEELSQRMGNKLDLAATAVINDKGTNQTLKSGESVKVILEHDYGFDYEENNANSLQNSLVSL